MGPLAHHASCVILQFDDFGNASARAAVSNRPTNNLNVSPIAHNMSTRAWGLPGCGGNPRIDCRLEISPGLACMVPLAQSSPAVGWIGCTQRSHFRFPALMLHIHARILVNVKTSSPRLSVTQIRRTKSRVFAWQAGTFSNLFVDRGKLEDGPLASGVCERFDHAEAGQPRIRR